MSDIDIAQRLLSPDCPLTCAEMREAASNYITQLRNYVAELERDGFAMSAEISQQAETIERLEKRLSRWRAKAEIERGMEG